VIRALDCHASDCQFQSRFGFVISGAPPVKLAVTSTCTLNLHSRESKGARRGVPGLWKPVYPDSYLSHGAIVAQGHGKL